MGRYFGLLNYTKGHKVSSYWKGSPPSSSEVVSIAQKLGWNLATDDIRSFSCADGYKWFLFKTQHDEKGRVDKVEESDQENEDSSVVGLWESITDMDSDDPRELFKEFMKAFECHASREKMIEVWNNVNPDFRVHPEIEPEHWIGYGFDESGELSQKCFNETWFCN